MRDIDYPRYFDKYGKKLKMLEWAKLYENPKYKIIQRTRLWWGGRVSTVWLGLDHSYDENRPLFFETMVFGWKYKFWGLYMRYSLDMDRYSGLAEARNGHIKMVKKWRNPLWGWWQKKFRK